MNEKVMEINAVPSYLFTTFQSQKVIVRNTGQFITIMPINELKADFTCPFLGIAKDSQLTVDKFLEWKREERMREHETDIRT